MKKVLFFTFFLCSFIGFASGEKMTAEEYIEKYKNEAIREMKRTGIPASITLAQGMLESGNGNSDLAKEANNHFGIKCHSDWTGKTFLKDDDEKNDCFRKYNHVLESFVDHSNFLTTKTRYAFLFEYSSTDYKSWAEGLKKAGYATNPKYPQLLINLIEKYELNQYDQKIRQSDLLKHKIESESEVLLTLNRINLSSNFIKTLIVKEGESIKDVSKLTHISVKRLLKYNEKTCEEISVGEILYLQPKKKSAREKYHTVALKETLYSISQSHGVTMKSIRKRNNIPIGQEPVVGQKLKLKGGKVKVE